MYVVSDEDRQKEFESKIQLTASKSTKKRVKFLDYDKVLQWHDKLCELSSIERQI